MKNIKTFKINKWMIFVLLIGIFIVFNLFRDNQKKKNILKLTNNVEISCVDVVKSTANVYYTIYGRYPVNFDYLVEDLKDEKEMDLSTVKRCVADELSQFEFNTRGDGKAVQIIYVDIYGKKQTTEINYSTDFH